MNANLQSWLEELKADGLHLSTEPGAGANENLWSISWPSSEPLAIADAVEFLWCAMKVRQELAALQRVRPVTFYAWHDEMAGRLRFSTACCTRSELPFKARITLVTEPSEIVADFVRSRFRDGIPVSELEEPTAAPPSSPTGPHDLRVWAVAFS